MNFIAALYIAIIFYIVTPGLFFSILKKGSFRVVVFLHSLLFAIIIYFTYDFIVSSINKQKEGFSVSMSLNGMPNLNTGANANININGNNFPISLIKDPSNAQGVILNIDDKASSSFTTYLQNTVKTSTPILQTTTISNDGSNPISNYN